MRGEIKLNCVLIIIGGSSQNILWESAKYVRLFILDSLGWKYVAAFPLETLNTFSK